MSKLIFVDCEAVGGAPSVGHLTEFGAVEYDSRETFHGILWDSVPDPVNPAVSIITGKKHNAVEVFTDFDNWLLKVCGTERPVFVSDNPAYDFQWINCGFWLTLGRNPFGHSGRRISDYYAGLKGDWKNTQGWKKLRVTDHDHNPVHDAVGNVEAFARLQAGER
jgi:hypothetical protein